MGDNKKWFKVWNSILTDPSFLDGSLEQIGRWALLGALLSLHGKKGQITMSKDALASLLRCEKEALKNIVLSLPNVHFEEAKHDNKMITQHDNSRDAKKDNGNITVIMQNWNKYQMDSTGYERLKRHRKKQKDNGLREEKTKRREEKNKNIVEPPNPEVREVVDFYKQEFEKQFHCEPVINYAASGKIVKTRLKEFTCDGLKDAIIQYFASQKARDHPTLSAAMSEHSLNLWQASLPK